MYRGGKWAKIPGDALVPGDVVSILREGGDRDGPMAGTCACWEGESGGQVHTLLQPGGLARAGVQERMGRPLDINSSASPSACSRLSGSPLHGIHSPHTHFDPPSPPRETDAGDDVVAQADMLLLAGSCIADEAVLTGESTPQRKAAIDAQDEGGAAALLDVNRDRAAVVFGGTKLLQTTGDKSARLRTPDGGCLAVVLRTGFGTAQGEPAWGGFVGGFSPGSKGLAGWLSG